MCFFDQHCFTCGDTNWGHFRQHCNKEYRMGETCGIKMVMQTICAQTRCKSCNKIDTKMRRRAAEVDRIHRWQKEGAKFRASIDKSMEVIRALDSEIYELNRERHRRQERALGPAFDGEIKLDDALPTAPGPLADRDEDYESDKDTDITSDEAGWDDENVGENNQRDPRRFGTTRISNTVASDSGYRSGHGTDTESVASLMSTGSSTYLSGTLLQEFIASFTKTLIDTSGALSWAAYTKAHSSPEEVERNLNKILKDYAIRLAAVSDIPDELRVQGQGLCQINLANASRLVRQYRSQIARSFSERLFSVSNDHTSLNVLLQRDERQLSLMERIGLLSRTLSHDDDLVDVVSLDPAMEDTIENDGEEDLLTILTDLRHSFISRGAFRLLATDVRRQLYRDDVIEMQSIKTIMEEGSLFRLRSGFHEANFSVHWPLKEFMRSQYDGDTPHIGSVIVLTGSALYAQATTCARYVEATWPTCGSYFLNVLNGVLQKATTNDDVGATEIGSIFSGPGLLVKITMYESRLSISASAVEEEQLAELAQQLAWLGCALRVSPYGNSSAHFEPLFLRKDLRAFEIMFKPSPIHATESACWLPLFCGAVIAAGFPIAERTEGIGLEIPIELLAGLSGTQHAVEYEGGIVMKGFSHMFVPIRKTADCLQWHAIMNQHPETRLTYETGISRCRSRAMLPEVSLRDITSLRAIVGWCMVANSKLGSESAAYGNIDYSKAEDVSGIGVHCSGGTLGFQQFGMASLDFRFGSKDGKCHFQRKGTFRKIAQVAENTPITLYDTGERRAWLVPASEVMLHIIQHRHRLDHFTLEGTCPSIDTSVSSESSARETLVKNISLSLSDEEEYTFKDEALNVWSLLEFLLDQNVTRHRNSTGTSLTATLREYIYGFEYKAVVLDRSPFKLKQSEVNKTNGGWPLLLQEIDSLILFADGFEDVLVPAEQGNTGLCRGWRRVPKARDYLTTTVKMLRQLHEEAGCRLSREYLTSKSKIQWHQGSSMLFESCRNDLRCECNRLQQLFPKTAVGTVMPPIQLYDKGAVIFGRSSIHITTAHRHNKAGSSNFYNQPNLPLDQLALRAKTGSSNDYDLVHASTNVSEETNTSYTDSLVSLDTNITMPDVASKDYEIARKSFQHPNARLLQQEQTQDSNIKFQASTKQAL